MLGWLGDLIKIQTDRFDSLLISSTVNIKQDRESVQCEVGRAEMCDVRGVKRRY